MTELFGIVFLIAFIDCLNPLNVTAHIYLLGTKRPFYSTFFFLSGIVFTYMVIGLILAVGVVALVTEYLREATWQF